MKKKLRLIGIVVACLITSGAARCSSAPTLIEHYNGLEVAASRGLRIAGLTGNIVMIIDCLNLLARWDKFFMTPQRHIEPSEIGGAVRWADLRKYQHVWWNSSVFKTLHKLQCVGRFMRNEDDGGSLSLGVEFLVQSAHGLLILYTANRIARDLLKRWYVRPQRALLGKECLVCYEENENNTLIAPCGNKNHHICVTCYPRLVGVAQHYDCLLCRCKMPRQEVRLDVVPLSEEVQHLSSRNRRRIYGLLAGQCAVLICLYLSFSTYSRGGHPFITYIDGLMFPILVYMAGPL